MCDVDVQIYDVRKCFDKLWYAETANDIFDGGVNDDQFVTISNSNTNCQVAVKTPWGKTTERKNMNNIEMQGTVLTSLKCSVQIDTLGKECLSTGEGIFKYKDCLSIPPLGFVDDVLGIAKCGVDSVKLNSIISSKMSTKKLELGHQKCFKLHVGNKSKNSCPILSVNSKEMKTSSSETYLGDVLTNDGKIDVNISARYDRGVGAINSIFSLLQEISFGQYFFEMAMLFRSSMLINSVLCSSEVLYGVKLKHLEILEKCDKMFFTKLFSVPQTCSYEAFFLETNALPIRYILIGRRFMYYWLLLNKADNELAKKVYYTQKQHRCKDDWASEIEDNLNLCNIQLTESEIQQMKLEDFKQIVKTQIRIKADEYLCSLRDKHSKTEQLTSYSFQNYLQSAELSTEEQKLLFQLRTRSTLTKGNYRNQYKFDMSCRYCKDKDSFESDPHLLLCPTIKNHLQGTTNISSVKYEDIFGDVCKQTSVAQVYQAIFKFLKLKFEV